MLNASTLRKRNKSKFDNQKTHAHISDESMSSGGDYQKIDLLLSLVVQDSSPAFISKLC